MTYLEESQAAGREIFPDLARAWALFGIALVNVGVLSWPMMGSYHAEGAVLGGLDEAAWFGVNALFLMKSYSLFSFMFGVGFAYQMQSAERRGVGFAGRYWRRIVGLLAFGALNITCFFIGDILVIYAVLGSLLFLFRNASQKTLIVWGSIIYGVQILIISLGALMIYLGVTYAPEEMIATAEQFAEADAKALEVFGSAGFAETVAYRLAEYLSGFPFMMMVQGFGAFAFFLFGLATVRSGVIARASAPIWKPARRFALPIGLLLSGAGGWLLVDSHGMIDPRMMLGLVFITIGSPFSTFGYLGLIAKWAEGAPGPITVFFARGGTSSLTAYLMQGLIFSLLFTAYGFGYFATLTAAQTIGVAFLVALFSVAFVSFWRVKFQRGPMEAILRRWTYLGAR
jgi:uncharacterized protein